MKRLIVLTLALFALVAFASGAMALTENSNTAQTSKRGSILIFPKVSAVTNFNPGLDVPAFQEDTLISIGNNGSDPVTVECVWKYPSLKKVAKTDLDIAITNPSITPDYWTYEQTCCGSLNFSFYLSGNDVYYFSAGTGIANLFEQGLTFEAVGKMPEEANGLGALTCFVIDKDRNPISYNQLYGDATIITLPLTTGYAPDGDPLADDRLLASGPTAWKYSAWALKARLDAFQPSAVKNPDGTFTLDLAGGKYGDKTYDACPDKLVFNFWPKISLAEGSANDPAGRLRTSQALPIFGTDLTVYPCTQDLRENGFDPKETIAFLRFNVWSPNENQFSGAYTCIKCWFEQVLGTTEKGRSYKNKVYNRDFPSQDAFPDTLLVTGYRDADSLANVPSDRVWAQPNFAYDNNRYRFPRTIDAFNLSNAANLDFVFPKMYGILGLYGHAQVEVLEGGVPDNDDAALYPWCTKGAAVDTGLVGVAYSFIDLLGPDNFRQDDEDYVWGFELELFEAGASTAINPDGVPEINPGTNVVGTGINQDKILWDPRT